MAELMEVHVITPKAQKTQVFAHALVAPTCEGQITVLAGHAAYLATLIPGGLLIQGDGPQQVFFTAGGLIEVHQDRVLLLLQSAERIEDIDVTRANQEWVAAKTRLAQLSGPEHHDYISQSRRLHRAEARVNTVREYMGS